MVHDLGGRVSSQEENGRREKQVEQEVSIFLSCVPDLDDWTPHSSCPQDTCAPQLLI